MNPVDKMAARLNENLSIFNTMIENIKQLNVEIEMHIGKTQEAIAAKCQEEEDLVAIRDQNRKIENNIKSLLK